MAASGAQLSILLQAVDQATAPIRGVTGALGGLGGAASKIGGALGSVASIASGFALGGGLMALPGLLSDAVQGAQDDEAATRRLEQSIRNLGGAYDEHLAQVNDAIDAGQKLAFSDDDVRDSFQSLAVATGSTEEALKRQKTAMDLARGANIPLATAAKMLGKVNEENVQAFKKLGITIADGATEAEALATVQAKFAGQSETYAKTTAGQFEQAQLAIGETKEAIGNALIPIVSKLAGGLATMLPQIQAFAAGLSEQVVAAIGAAEVVLGPFIALMAERLQPILADVIGFFGQLGTAFSGGSFTEALGPVGAFVDNLRDLATNIWPILQGLFEGGSLSDALGQIGPVFQEYLANLLTIIADLGGKLLDWIEPLIPVALEKLGALVSAAVAWVEATGLPALMAGVATWAEAFWVWAQDAVPPLLERLGGMLLTIGTWMATTALPAILVKLGEWALAFVTWIGDALPKALDALGTFLTSFIDGLATGGTDMGTEVDTSWVAAVVDWIATKALPALEKALPKILIALLKFVLDVSIAIARLIVERLVPAFLDWIVNDVVPALPGLLAQILIALVTWINDHAISESARESARIGAAIIDGISGAITNGAGRIATAARNAASAAFEAAKDVLGIDSPSKAFASIGRNIGLGMEQGILASGRGVRAAAGRMAGESMGGAQAVSRTLNVTVNNPDASFNAERAARAMYREEMRRDLVAARLGA